MRLFSIVSMVAAAAMICSTAMADEATKPDPLMGNIANASAPAVVQQDDTKDRFRAGFDVSLGVPSGAEVGFVFEPWTHWTRLELGLAHNSMSFGGVASATFTPIHFPIMPVLEVEAGFFPQASLPAFVSSGKTLPTVGYDWVSFGPGLEFGSRDHVVFFLHPAITYMHISAGNMQNTLDSNGGGNGIQLGDATINGWIMPTFRMGLSVLF